MNNDVIDDYGVDMEEYFADPAKFLKELQEQTDDLEMCGYNLLIRCFTQKQTEFANGSAYILATDVNKISESLDDRFGTLMGLVTKVAPAAYQDKEVYQYTGAYCQVGDWVMFPRASGYTFNHDNNKTMIAMMENKIILKARDPRKIRLIKAK